MKKKIFLGVIVLLMVVTLSGCKDKKDNTVNNQKEEEQVQGVVLEENGEIVVDSDGMSEDSQTETTDEN